MADLQLRRTPLASYTASLRLPLIFAVALAGALSTGGTSLAATFTVTKNPADGGVGADTADGACDVDCSLREAISAANAAPGADTIQLSDGSYWLTIAGSGDDANNGGDLDITDDVTIQGTGYTEISVVPLNFSDSLTRPRIFDIIAGAVAIKGIAMRAGGGEVGSACECGGAIYVRAGASLEITDSDVSANGVPTGTGGGIENQGTLTLTNTSFISNDANFAGGINNAGSATLTMTGGGLQTNQARDGSAGGIAFGPGSTGTLTGVSFHSNRAGASAGAIHVSGTVTLVDGFFQGNSAGVGGAVEVSGGTLRATGTDFYSNNSVSGGGGIFNNGDVTLINSTVRSNTAGYAEGGGVLNSAGANLTATNVTFSSNSQAIHNLGTATLENTIVAYSPTVGSFDNCGGPAAITSAGHNLDSGNSCGFGGAGDLPNRDPKLIGVSLDNTLQADSPAIDAGNNAVCPATDQRSPIERRVARPQDGDGDGSAICDIGSYEVEGVPSTARRAAAGVPGTTPAPAPESMPELTAAASASQEASPTPTRRAKGTPSPTPVLSQEASAPGSGTSPLAMGLAGASVLTLGGAAACGGYYWYRLRFRGRPA